MTGSRRFPRVSREPRFFRDLDTPLTAEERRIIDLVEHVAVFAGCAGSTYRTTSSSWAVTSALHVIREFEQAARDFDQQSGSNQ
jgi:hypothetical protein